MIRTGMTCLAVLLIAGCTPPISLNDDRPPLATGVTGVTGGADAAMSTNESGLGSVQILPIDPPAIDSPTTDSPATDNPTIERPAGERLRGVLDERGWQLCGQNQPKQMRASSKASGLLESFLARNRVFFLDGWGRVVGNEIELDSVERMYVEGPGCREPLESFAWVAHGQAPFWAFAITHSGMQLRRPGEPPLTYVYTAPRTEGEHVVYAGPDYRLTLHRQTCRGTTKADPRYAWVAELQAEGQQWRGCAWQGMQVESP